MIQHFVTAVFAAVVVVGLRIDDAYDSELRDSGQASEESQEVLTLAYDAALAAQQAAEAGVARARERVQRARREELAADAEVSAKFDPGLLEEDTEPVEQIAEQIGDSSEDPDTAVDVASMEWTDQHPDLADPMAVLDADPIQPAPKAAPAAAPKPDLSQKGVSKASMLAEALSEVKSVRDRAREGHASAAELEAAIDKAQQEIREVKGELKRPASLLQESAPAPPEAAADSSNKPSLEVPTEPAVVEQEKAELPKFMQTTTQEPGGFKLFGDGLCQHNGESKVMQPVLKNVSHEDCRSRCSNDVRCLSFSERARDGFCIMHLVRPDAVKTMSAHFEDMQCWEKILSTDRAHWLHMEELHKQAEESSARKAAHDWAHAKEKLDSYNIPVEGWDWNDQMWKPRE